MNELDKEYLEEDRVPLEEEYTTEEEVVVPNVPKQNRDALYASIANGFNQDPSETFSAIQQEFATQGHSPLEGEIKKDIKQTFLDDFLPPVVQGAINIPTEAKGNFINALPEIVDEESTTKAVALENLSHTSKEDPVVGAEEWHNWYMSRVNRTSKVREQTARAIQGVASTFSLANVDMAADFADLLLPGQTIAVGRVGKKYLGEHYVVMEGDLVRDLAAHIRQAPLEEQVGLAKSIAEDIGKAAGVTPGIENNMAAAYLLQDLEEYAISYRPEDDMKIARYLGNAVGMIDLAGLTPLRHIAKLASSSFRSATRMSNRSTGDVIETVSEANPNIGSELTYNAIQDADAATALNTTPEAAYATTGPHMPILTEDGQHLLDGAPQSTIDRLNDKVSRSEQLMDDYVNTELFVDADFAAKEQAILRALDSVEIDTVTIPASSSVTRIPGTNTLDVTVAYGANTDFPIPNLLSAMKMKAKLMKALEDSGIKGPKIDLMVKDDVTGGYRPYIHNSDDADSPFMISYRTKYEMGAGDVAAKETGTREMGRLVKYLVNPLGRVERSLISAARVARDKKFVFNRDLADISSSFVKMKDGTRNQVVDILKQGEEDRVNYTYREIVNSHGRDIAEGYVSARMAFDTVHTRLNFRLKKKLEDAGYKGINYELPDGSVFESAGVPYEKWLDAKDSGVTRVFDPETGRGWDLGNITEKYSNGYKLVKLHSKVNAGEQGYFTHAWVKSTSIGNIPEEVLPKIPGYLLRINTDPYFVIRNFEQTVDGVRVPATKVMKVARNVAEAREAVRALSSEIPADQLSYRVDRSIDLETSMLDVDSKMLGIDNNPVWYKKRGERLLRMDGSDSAVEDPITALEKAAGALANTEAHHGFVEISTAQHISKYKDIVVDGKPLYQFNKKTGTMEFNPHNIPEIKDKRIKAANREYEYIQAISGIPTDTDRLWQRSIRGLDEYLGNWPLLSKVGGKLIRPVAANSPDNIARTVTFYSLLALDPPRQLLLNAMNGMHLMGVDPKATLSSINDAKWLSISMGIWDNPKLWNGFLKSMEKTGKYTAKEWTDIFEGFRNSGKGYSIDSHVVVAESNYGWKKAYRETKLGVAGRKVTNLAKSPAVLGKNFGFNAGEFYNQSFSYLFAIKQWQKKNPGMKWNANQKTLNEITDKARTYATDMTITDALPYQKGALAALTQFTSFSHKALLNALPAKLGGNPDFVGVRARYHLGMLATYGLSGWGVAELYNNIKREYGVDVPPELDNLIQGGMSDAILNTSADLLTGEEWGTNRVRAAKSISMGATQWTFPLHIVENMADGNFLEAITGPSGKVFPTYYDAATRVKQMWGFDDLDTAEKVTESVEILFENFGVFSKFFQYNAAMAYQQELGEYHNVTKSGGFAGKATHTELLWKKWFGFTNETQEEFYNSWLKLNREVSGKSGDKVKENDAKKMAWWLNQAWIESGGDEVKFYKKSSAIIRALHRGNEVYGEEVFEKTKIYLARQPAYEEMMMNIAEKSLLMDSERYKDRLDNMVKTSSMIKDDKQRADILFMIETMHKEIKDSNKLLGERE